MSGYRPVNLSEFVDAEVASLPNADAPEGSCVFFGLPFEVQGLVSFRQDDVVEIPIKRIARWIIFAHALFETSLYDGSAIGEETARYTFSSAKGPLNTIPIRERLEIGATPRRWPDRPLPLDWGQGPLLARPDSEQVLMPRAYGRFDQQGARLQGLDDPQTREPYVLPYSYFLWTWRNPQPELPVESVRVEADEPTGFIAAITTSDLQEEPFDRSLARDLILKFDNEVDPEQISIEVDRGTASYPLCTVSRPTGVAGFGEEVSGLPNKLHARVSGSPSATVTVKQAGEAIAVVPWAGIEGHEVAGLTFTLAADHWAWVRGRIVDAESGESLCARIHLRDCYGVPWAPQGHHPHINSDMGTWYTDIGGDVRLGRHTFAYVDGEFEGWLPCGDIEVEIARGFEYEPVATTIRVSPDSTSFVFKLSRIANLVDSGQLGGDTHVHFMSTNGVLLEGRGEGLGVVNLLASQWHDHYSSTEELIGCPVTSPDGMTTVFASQESRQNVFGHLCLLGLREPILPWGTGGPEEAELGGGLEATLSHWADECRSQGGAVILAHFPCPYGETPALIATERLDAVETLAWDQYNLGEWYRYLDAGFRLPLVGGTDKMTAEVPLGLMRTYSRIPEGAQHDFDGWIAGIKAGDTFVTSGPLLEFSVNGETAGSTIMCEPGDTVRIEADVSSIFPIDRLEVVSEGEVVASSVSSEPVARLSIAEEIVVRADTWIAVRCGDMRPQYQSRHLDTWGRPIGAHSSPVYVSTGGEYFRDDATVRASMVTLIEGCLAYLRERAVLGAPGQFVHRHGRQDHLNYLSQPFVEALEALRDREGRLARRTG